MTPILNFLLAVAFASLGVVFANAPGGMDAKKARLAAILFYIASALFIVAGIIGLVA